MPHEHILYIPFVLLTGFITGVIFGRRKRDASDTTRPAPSPGKNGLFSLLSHRIFLSKIRSLRPFVPATLAAVWFPR